ncbi:MAG: hypothetical protein JNN04_07865 [Cyclobacteriaceae bacterium]|nr:hypothetical protein [Cyclobacteriaceae bacterium]
MEQRPLVYVNHITNLSDARYCAGMGVDLLGFNIDPSDPDYVSPETYQQLVGWVSGPERVVVAGSVPFNDKRMVEDYAPQYVHLHGAQLNNWPATSLKLIVEIPAESLADFRQQLEARTDIAFLVVPNLKEPITPALTGGIPVLAGLEPSARISLAQLEKAGVAGIVLQGTKESSPGLKDYDHLSQVLEDLIGSR